MKTRAYIAARLQKSYEDKRLAVNGLHLKKMMAASLRIKFWSEVWERYCA